MALGMSTAPQKIRQFHGLIRMILATAEKKREMGEYHVYKLLWW